ncbi:MAG: DNA-3-methyladenine glycosylase [Chloroflexi bacterium RBG_19FT_COMBO_47_9]|nr:MAG: DNA-3-methyladenine glycosylase [Chloroflexi bacterium RBG_19FT_COMBO_47_9]
MTTRCFWANTDDQLYLAYHDQEWGVPVHDDRLLFEFLILEGAQAGLSWYTILRKRPNYHLAFDNFDPLIIAQYDQQKGSELLANPGIIRNKLKINATIQNAQAYIRINQEFDSFDSYIWQFVSGKPIINAWKISNDIPAETEVSKNMSKDLLKRGFHFVGPTICYAFMQAVGMVNDHTIDCFRYQDILDLYHK